MNIIEYPDFIHQKTHEGASSGFEPMFIPEILFDFQESLTTWAIEKGRAAIFADCGLGKTGMQLVWAENIRLKTNKPVLVATPLAVSAQTIREGEKFGIEVRRSNDGTAHNGINVTNYEKLHLFNPNDFAGMVCDESSILKSFDGSRRQERHFPTPTSSMVTIQDLEQACFHSSKRPKYQDSFPTPTSTMYKRWSKNHNRANTDDRIDYKIEREASQQGNGGSLNPTWVEWLMGWPLGWTDLKPLATDKFQQWLQQHSEFLQEPNHD